MIVYGMVKITTVKFVYEQKLHIVIQDIIWKKNTSLLLGKLIYIAFRRQIFRQNLLVSKLLSTLVSLTMMLNVKNCYTYLFLFTFMEIHFESISTEYFNDIFCLYRTEILRLESYSYKYKIHC